MMDQKSEICENNMEAVMRETETKTSNKLINCSQCNYTSSRSGHLRRHMKTHSGEKTNKCDQCDYTSYQASDLRKHLKTHSGEKSNK